MTYPLGGNDENTNDVEVHVHGECLRETSQ